MVGRLLSYWEGNFSGAMLNFGKVTLPNMVNMGLGLHVGGPTTLFLCQKSLGFAACSMLGIKGPNIASQNGSFFHGLFCHGRIRIKSPYKQTQ